MPSLETILTIAALGGTGVGTGLAAFFANKALKKTGDIEGGQEMGKEALEAGINGIKDVILELSKDIRQNRDEFVTAFSGIREKMTELDDRFTSLRTEMTKQHNQLAERVTALEGSIEHRVKIENRISILESLFIQKPKKHPPKKG